MILPMTDDFVPRQGRGLWVDSFWRSESIVTVLRPNSPGLQPAARSAGSEPDRLNAIRRPHNIKVWVLGHPLGSRPFCSSVMWLTRFAPVARAPLVAGMVNSAHSVVP
jgi:hypothetical protein